MRAIALILSLLILFSSMQPCSDGNNEHEHQDEISANHNHQNDLTFWLDKIKANKMF